MAEVLRLLGIAVSRAVILCHPHGCLFCMCLLMTVPAHLRPGLVSPFSLFSPWSSWGVKYEVPHLEGTLGYLSFEGQGRPCHPTPSCRRGTGKP